MLAVPGLKADDLTRPELRSVHRLAQQGAVGWMITRTAYAGVRTNDAFASGFLTIGAGARAVADLQVPPHVPLVLSDVAKRNRELDHPVPLGAVGDVCRSAGLRISVTDDSLLDRSVLLMAMDSKGRVDTIATALVRDSDEPFGVRSEPSRYPAPAKGWLIVWVFSDLSRCDAYDTYCTPEMSEAHRARALVRLDALLRRLMQNVRQLRENNVACMAWVLSPAPSAAVRRLDRLTPILLQGDEEPGWITSASTRRRGLVLNTDVLASIAQFLDRPLPKGATGRPVSGTGPPSVTVSDWRALHDRLLRAAVVQFWLGTMPGVRFSLMLVLVLSTVLATTLRHSALHVLARAIAGAMLGMVTIQALSGWLPPLDLRTATIILGVFTVAGVWLAYAGVRRAALMGSLVCGTIGLGVLILLTAAPERLAEAWLTYSTMLGTRLYGIGNELGGVWVGGLAFAVAHARSRPGHGATAAVLVACAVAAMHPAHGANFGVGIACVILAAWQLAGAAGPRVRVLLFASLSVSLIAIAIVVVLLLDRGPGASHIGRALSSHAGLGAVIVRKLGLNLATLVQSLWTLVAMLGIGACRFAVTRLSHGVVLDLSPLYVGTTALLLFNDTGIVAAGLCLATAVPALVLTLAPPTAIAPQAQRVGDHRDRG